VRARGSKHARNRLAARVPLRGHPYTDTQRNRTPYGLRAACEIIAVQYNLLARGVCYLYLSGFDPRFGRFSPGMLLLRQSHPLRDRRRCTRA
jgi:hypothetical protein